MGNISESFNEQTQKAFEQSDNYVVSGEIYTKSDGQRKETNRRLGIEPDGGVDMGKLSESFNEQSDNYVVSGEPYNKSDGPITVEDINAAEDKALQAYQKKQFEESDNYVVSGEIYTKSDGQIEETNRRLGRKPSHPGFL